MPIMNTTDDAQLALSAAQAGASVVRELYGAPLARVSKSAGDFATEADFAAERTVLDLLRTARPEDAVTGEESGATGTAGTDRRWLVDPLCGTLNYAVQNMLVGVNVALRVTGAGAGTTAAATADPFNDEVFWTDGTHAALRKDGSDTTLKPSPSSGLVDLNLDPPFPTFRTARLLTTPGFADRFRPRVVSTTLALAWVAAGRRAAYITDGDDLRDSVHFAAGIALCEAAGCTVTGIDGLPLTSSAGGLVAAADTETHTALMKLVKEHLPS